MGWSVAGGQVDDCNWTVPFSGAADKASLVESNVILASAYAMYCIRTWAEEAVGVGALRLCAICDGYEAGDGRLACYGPITRAIRHAAFLRTFSRQVFVAPESAEPAKKADLEAAAKAGVRLLSGPCRLEFDGHNCHAVDAQDNEHRFDALYPVLGSHARSELAMSSARKTTPAIL